MSSTRPLRELLPEKRPKRNLALLLAGLVMLTHASAIAGANDPRPTLLYPGIEDSRRSQDVPIVFARFDRPLREGSHLRVFDSSATQVPGIVRLNEPDHEHESWRMLEFLPTDPLSEAASPYEARAWACPLVADCVSIVWTFHIDDTAPAAPTIDTPLSNALVTDQVVTVRGDAEPGATILVFEVPDMQTVIARDVADEDGDYTVQLPYPPEDGVEHRIRVAARDRAGNISALTPQRRFIHDSILFLPIITWPLGGSFTNVATVPVEGRAKAGSTATVLEATVVIGSAPVDPDERFTAPIGFADGSHTIVVESDDGLLVDGPSPAVTFTVDTIAPAAPSITVPLPGSSVPGPRVLVTGAGEPHGTIRLRDGGNLIAEGEIPVSGTWSVLVDRPDGPVALTAEVRDRAGNVGPQTARTFIVDSVDPVAPIITTPADGSVLGTALVGIAGTAEADALVAIMSNDTVLGTTLANGSGAFATVLPFADGGHTIVAHAIDAAGNVSDASDDVSFGVDTVAPLPPLIAQPFPGDVYNRVPLTVSGTSEPAAGITIYEGTTSLATTTATSDGAWSARITVAPGSRTIHATATDRAGNVSGPGPSVTFTYDVGAPDLIAPGPPIISLPLANGIVEPVVVFRGFAEPFARVDIKEGATILATANAAEDGIWDTSLLMSGGTHHVHAFATDRAGNTGPASAVRSFTVDVNRPVVDITSLNPGIALPGATGVVSGTATDDTLVTRIEIEATNRITGQRFGVYLASCLSCPAPGVSWSANVPVPPGLYRVEAYAVDAAGRRSVADSSLLLHL